MSEYQPIELQHADYPHWPGYMYDCAACEPRCFCDTEDNPLTCIHCEAGYE